MHSITWRCFGGRTRSTSVTHWLSSNAVKWSSVKPSWCGIWPRSIRRRISRPFPRVFSLRSYEPRPGGRRQAGFPALASVGASPSGFCRPRPQLLVVPLLRTSLLSLVPETSDGRTPRIRRARGARPAPSPVWLYQRGGLPSVHARLLQRSCRIPSPGTWPNVRRSAGFLPGSRLAPNSHLPLEDEDRSERRRHDCGNDGDKDRVRANIDTPHAGQHAVDESQDRPGARVPRRLRRTD